MLGLLALRSVDAQALQNVLADNVGQFPRLNFSDPSPLIFHSTFGLLQQWLVMAGDGVVRRVTA